jgi:low molecular weight protein-tyrosine phosphatase
VNGGNELHVVFVCTGNRFRSPLAAALLERAMNDQPVTVESAGTLDLGPLPPFLETIEEGHRLGVDVSAHRARSVRELDLHSADLVLGFEQVHVARAVVEASAPRGRSFTLPELVDLLRACPEKGRGAIAVAHALRDEQRRRQPSEVADPVGRGGKAFQKTADDIDRLVTELVALLFP